jgi:STAS-like domain of unknown function (DUF4325)
MSTAEVRVHDVLKDKILVSRESARKLWDVVQQALAGAGKEPLVVDFAGVEGLAPSFLDELLAAIDASDARAKDHEGARLIISHPPARLSLKFEAVARGRSMSIEALPDGSWLLTKRRPGTLAGQTAGRAVR